jgi:hypothetical protein
MNKRLKAKIRKYMKDEAKLYSEKFVIYPPETIAQGPKELIEAWRNNRFLVQVFEGENCYRRLSICLSEMNENGSRWLDGITWDELQSIKNVLGYEDRCAIEFFPPKNKVVNVANMRHLFILDQPLECMW